MTTPYSFGLSPLGIGPYGPEFVVFGVTSATAVNPGNVIVEFSDLVDFADPAILTPGNYAIVPALPVTGVFIETAKSVRLVTTPQSFVAYELTVTTARGMDGTLLSPALRTVFFTGFSVNPGYFSAGTSPTRVRCCFSAPMLMNAALSDPASYTVTDANGTPLPVVSAVPEQSADPRSVLLTLGVPMGTTKWYVTTLVGAVQTEDLLTPLPVTSAFQFVESSGNFSVGLNTFTGEVQGGLFGNPAGLVFFSPALQASIANSVLQVDEVAACTTAYDVYTPPSPPDPVAFYTWSPLGPKQTLGQSGVALWAPFPRLFEARFELGMGPTSLVEPMPPPADNSCSITMREPWDPAFVALLNNPAWKLFDNTGLVVPPLFICANNLAPIPPGATYISTLIQQQTGGNSVMHVSTHRNLGLTASLTAGSAVTATPTVP